ncbi:hypothetical protein AB6N23_16175 [Cellulomonas sp. 179-A 9B4 NHS]|uniref:hypothetical protein n=1 Tax=Cellulomonas sp. 179-A 9B4 NHS TaxID=3142379 RepID=UPI0039A2CEA5
MDQTAPPSGAAPYARPEPWPIDEWREPAIGVAIAALTLPAVTSALVGLLVLAVQGRASWLLVTLSALVTAVIGVLAAAVAFRRRDRRPVRLLAAVAAGWGVATLVAGVVVGLELETSERVPLAVMLVVGGAWTVVLGLLLWLAWRLLPPGASDVPRPTPSGDDDGTAADAPTTGTAGGTPTGAAPRSATKRAPGVTSPGPASTDDATGTAARASDDDAADGDADLDTRLDAGTDADQAALADWPEWGAGRDAAAREPGAGTTRATSSGAHTAATAPAATSVPATSVPATSVPATSAPATSAPVTSAPVTSASATSASATSAPATSAATPVPDEPPAAPAPSRPATPRRTASSATPPPTSVDDTMVVDGPLLDDDAFEVPEPPTATPPRRSVSSPAVRGRRSGSGDRPTQRLSGRDPEGGPPTQRMPHVDR